MVRFVLDRHALPQLSPADRARLDAMTDAEITQDALADPDNPPLTDAELDRAVTSRLVRRARGRTGLSQARFAATFRINICRLRDLEQGRTQADSAMLAYLAVIEREQDAVTRALAAADM